MCPSRLVKVGSALTLANVSIFQTLANVSIKAGQGRVCFGPG